MDASPICRGQNLTMETVLTFMHAMPKQAMAKADFNAYAESRMNGWTQTHSQIARQMALYYEEGGVCYPRFGSKVSIGDIVEYAKHWATRYFIPNPYTPSLKGKTPTTIYAYLKKAIHEGKYTFSEACNSIFPETTLNNLDKVRVFIVNFTDILVEGDKMSVNNEVKIDENTEIYPSIEALTPKEYFYHFGGVIESAQADHQNEEESPFQQIFYGAPGTGKSHEVKKITGEIDGNKPNVFRTTFHPDTDYASFVGCYKPVMKPVPENLRAVAGREEDIAYEFVPQAFTDAYIYAYNHTEETTYLVIEEINRGNCAQIFGDLFQLLDRNENGTSDYLIKADKDLAKYLIDTLGIDSPGIKDGKLTLPANLRILATMNTSDQSLFPIDSAFKRRWDWEYVAIDYAEPKSSAFTITIGNTSFRWVDFIKVVNQRIYDVTQSEDKQMGNFFIKSSVNQKQFCSKVMFYLWNEVLKDEVENSKYFFYEDKGNNQTSKFTFTDVYGGNATSVLTSFMKYLGVNPLQNQPAQNEEQQTDTDAQ